MEVITKSASDTEEFGKKIANTLKGGEILTLVGELGSGKTTFVKGLAKGLGIDQRIISPTFIIMRKYKIKVKGQRSKVNSFYHVDLYRLEGAVETELKNIGAPSYWGKKANIVAIEWADKATGIYPKNRLKIKFNNIGGDKRKIAIK